MDVWAELLRDSPYIAIILALAITVIYLFRSRDKLQAKYADDLVKATGALNELTAEYLKQAFADSAAWQDRVGSLETTFRKHSDTDRRIEDKLADIQAELIGHETRVKEYVDRAIDRALDKTEKAFDRAR